MSKKRIPILVAILVLLSLATNLLNPSAVAYGAVPAKPALARDELVYRPAKNIRVTTLAGTGSHGNTNGESASFNLPYALAGTSARLYVADTYNNLIREVKKNGTNLVAGDIIDYDSYRFPKGYYRDGGANIALFNRPNGLVVNGKGQVFITDSGNNAIRVQESGMVYTLAGGEAGFVDGSYEKARFNGPSAVAIDRFGNLYVADTLNHCIRKVFPNNSVNTIAGIPGKPGFADARSNRAMFNSPMGIAVSQDGLTVYVADTGNHRIRVIENGAVRTLAGSTTKKDADGDPLGGYADGPGKSAMFNLPFGLSYVDGALVVADSGNNRIRAVTPGGEVVTLAGSGEPGSVDGRAKQAAFHLPKGVFVTDNVVYIADTGNNQIRRMPLDMDIFER